MSYARWSNSHWYAYWDTSVSDEDISKTQGLTFCGVASFSEHDIRQDPEACISVLKEKSEIASESDLDEARDILKHFLTDIRFYREKENNGNSDVHLA